MFFVHLHVFLECGFFEKDIVADEKDDVTEGVLESVVAGIALALVFLVDVFKIWEFEAPAVCDFFGFVCAAVVYYY